MESMQAQRSREPPRAGTKLESMSNGGVLGAAWTQMKVLKDGVPVALTIDGDTRPFPVLLMREAVRVDIV